MIFDVMLEMGRNELGKQIVRVYRIHDRHLSKFIRDAQYNDQYIISVIPLFKQKKESDELDILSRKGIETVDFDGF